MTASEDVSKESIARIEGLVAQVEAMPDPVARDAAVELVRGIMELHAAALERMLCIAADAPQMIAALAEDELVSRVLVLHGLHPDDFCTRLARAVGRLAQYFDSRGGSIELLEAEPDLVRVRVVSKRPGAGVAARRAIDEAIYEAVPEVGRLIVEGVEEDRGQDFVPLASLLTDRRI